MKAIIVGLNLSKSRAVAETTDGEYVLIELFTDEPDLHDEISGNFDEHPLGGEIIRNITSGTNMDVYIQDYCSKSVAEKYLKGV